MSEQASADPWIVYEGGKGPGQGKHIVFVAGDEEYRSEDSMPMLAKIAAVRQGFRCTMLFAISHEDGAIDPETLDNIPGLEALQDADLMVMFTRFRALPEQQMQRVLAYIDSGKPMISLRTNTHAFRYPDDSPYAEWSFKAEGGGFGGRVFGQTWINHHGSHKGSSTRAKIVPGQASHPVLRGVSETFWGPSDVYGVLPLIGECAPLVMGHVITGKAPDGEEQLDKEPMPVVWTKTYTGPSGKPARVLTTTMGHSFDMLSEDLRGLLINACFWGMGLEDKIPDKANVDFVGEYSPNEIGAGGHKKGLKPDDHKIQ